jgi:hypothetical protein
MITRADIAAGLDHPWAVLLLAAVVGVLGAWFILATANALWLRFGPDEPVEPIDDIDDDAWFRAAVARRVMEGQ